MFNRYSKTNWHSKQVQHCASPRARETAASIAHRLSLWLWPPKPPRDDAHAPQVRSPLAHGSNTHAGSFMVILPIKLNVFNALKLSWESQSETGKQRVTGRLCRRAAAPSTCSTSLQGLRRPCHTSTESLTTLMLSHIPRHPGRGRLILTALSEEREGEWACGERERERESRKETEKSTTSAGDFKGLSQLPAGQQLCLSDCSPASKTAL